MHILCCFPFLLFSALLIFAIIVFPVFVLMLMQHGFEKKKCFLTENQIFMCYFLIYSDAYSLIDPALGHRHRRHHRQPSMRHARKDVRQLLTAERHLLPKCTNFGVFTTKVYEFWCFYHQSVRIFVFF